MQFLTYAIDLDEGTVYSRMNHQPGQRDRLAVPVLEFAEFGQDGDFTGEMGAHLEAFPLEVLYSWRPRLRWTKKIPVELKNRHRAFWGLKPLPDRAVCDTVQRSADAP